VKTQIEGVIVAIEAVQQEIAKIKQAIPFTIRDIIWSMTPNLARNGSRHD
jgi:hypothetical protein